MGDAIVACAYLETLGDQDRTSRTSRELTPPVWDDAVVSFGGHTAGSPPRVSEQPPSMCFLPLWVRITFTRVGTPRSWDVGSNFLNFLNFRGMGNGGMFGSPHARGDNSSPRPCGTAPVVAFWGATVTDPGPAWAGPSVYPKRTPMTMNGRRPRVLVGNETHRGLLPRA